VSKWFYDTSTGTGTRAAHCGSFVGEGLGASNVSYGGTWWRRGFTWFGPSKLIPFVHGRIGVLMYCCVLNLPKRVLGF
jgi:hypothetical protein